MSDGGDCRTALATPGLLNILNLRGYLNCIIGSTVTANFLNRWILPLGGVASERESIQSRLFYFLNLLIKNVEVIYLADKAGWPGN